MKEVFKHILPFNTESDVFMHMYNVTSTTNARNNEIDVSMDPDDVRLFTEATDIVSQTDHDFHSQYSVTNFERYFPDPHHQWHFPTSLHNMIKQWYSIEQVWNRMVSHVHPDRKHVHAEAGQCTHIGFFRSDVEYQTDINISDWEAIAPFFNN